jgi:hypothetical protein
MANYNLIELPTRMLKDQALAHIGALQAKLNNGEVQAQYELLGVAASAYNLFYGNLGRALSVAFPFTGLPVAQTWNKFQQLLSSDMQVLYNQANQIQKAVATGIAFATIETNLLKDATASLASALSSFTSLTPVNHGYQRYIVSDGFQDSSKVDLTSTTALIQPGSILLSRGSEIDYTSKVDLWVDDEFIRAAHGDSSNSSPGSSNGFPGNCHEVTIVSNTNPNTSSSTLNSIPQIVQLNAAPGQSIAFVGDTDLHSDVAAITDGDTTTWFEYEVCNIPDTIKNNPCLGYGFNIMVTMPGKKSLVPVPWYSLHEINSTGALAYFPPPPSTYKNHSSASDTDSSGNFVAGGQTFSPRTQHTTPVPISLDVNSDSVDPNGEVLRLVLQGSLATPARITEVSILPNVLKNKRPIVKSVMVRSASSSAWIQGAKSSNFSNPALVDITEVSPAIDGVEVWTLPETDVSYIQIVLEQPQSYSTKIGHLVWLDGIGLGANLLDTAVGSSAYTELAPVTRIDGPNLSLQSILQNSSDVVGTIEDISAYQSSITGPLIEVFDGWRYAIALRDISFKSYSYELTDVLVTQDYQTPIDIKSVSLDVHEVIPNGDHKFDWIKYDISLDGGASWYPISPASHLSSSDPKSYDINPTTPGASTIKTNYDVNHPAQFIRLRATLARPGSDASLTPRLLNYRLILEGNLT